MTYHHTQPLRFKHLKPGELFVFPPGAGTPMMGPYQKLSARRYIAVSVSAIGERLVANTTVFAAPLTVGSVNVAVSCNLAHLLPY